MMDVHNARAKARLQAATGANVARLLHGAQTVNAVVDAETMIKHLHAQITSLTTRYNRDRRVGDLTKAMAYVDDSIELHQGDVDAVVKDIRGCQLTQYHELKQDIIDIYTLMQTMGDTDATKTDVKPPGLNEQIPGQQKLEDLYWWKRVCPETPKLVAQVACYARCRSCVRCLVGYRL